jgi:hypothetical protein
MHQLPSPKTVRCRTINCRTSVSRFLPYQRTLFPLFVEVEGTKPSDLGVHQWCPQRGDSHPQALTAGRQRAFSASRPLSPPALRRAIRFPGGQVLAGLGERHPVQGGVELAVPGPAQAAGLCWPTKPAGTRCRYGGRRRPWTGICQNAGCLTEDLGGGQRPATRFRNQCGHPGSDEAGDLHGELVDSAVSWRQRATSARANRATVPSRAEMRASTWSSTAPRSSGHARARRVYSKDTQIRA